jgi:hypothetical protein
LQEIENEPGVQFWKEYRPPMLRIQSNDSSVFCDGRSRRNFLRIGGFGAAGLGLPGLLEAEQSSGAGRRGHKALIMIFLPGGPPHQDMFDLKPDAPREIRGEFSSIPTNVPGLRICEEFPRMAQMMDKFAVVRSVVGADGRHDAQQCLTGKPMRGAPPGGWPSIGAAIAKLEGGASQAVPPFLGLSPKTGHEPWSDPGQAGFLGAAYAAFQPFRGGGQQDLVLKGVSLERLRDRKQLLASFDRFRHEFDASGVVEGMDAFHQQAFGVLTSSQLADALDITKETPATIARYGRGSEALKDDGSWRRLDQFLMARRLVEAGARVVTLSFSRWDWHSANFRQGREEFPLLDQGLSALVGDLHDRGLDRDVSVVVWGEFGRTPIINPQGGRDHWPRVSCALLAGGGMRTGQVIGATDRLGGEAVERPVHFQEIFSTLYHNLGIDGRKVTFEDMTGRPQYLVDAPYAPMRELVG